MLVLYRLYSDGPRWLGLYSYTSKLNISKTETRQNNGEFGRGTLNVVKFYCCDYLVTRRFDGVKC